MGDSLRLYEVVNPSDKATFYAPNDGIAAIAVLLLDGGRGAYGAVDVETREGPPMFLFGGAEEWFTEQGLWPLDDAIDRHRDEIAKALSSVALGSEHERREYDLALEHIESEEARQRFISERNDDRRSSLNNFEARAHEIARRLSASEGGDLG